MLSQPLDAYSGASCINMDQSKVNWLEHESMLSAYHFNSKSKANPKLIPNNSVNVTRHQSNGNTHGSAYRAVMAPRSANTTSGPRKRSRHISLINRERKEFSQEPSQTFDMAQNNGSVTLI